MSRKRGTAGPPCKTWELFWCAKTRGGGVRWPNPPPPSPLKTPTPPPPPRSKEALLPPLAHSPRTLHVHVSTPPDATAPCKTASANKHQRHDTGHRLYHTVVASLYETQSISLKPWLAGGGRIAECQRDVGCLCCGRGRRLLRVLPSSWAPVGLRMGGTWDVADVGRWACWGGPAPNQREGSGEGMAPGDPCGMEVWHGLATVGSPRIPAPPPLLLLPLLPLRVCVHGCTPPPPLYKKCPCHGKRGGRGNRHFHFPKSPRRVVVRSSASAGVVYPPFGGSFT